MNYWLVSDTHFNHLKLEEWGGRSGDWQTQIWKGIETIPPGDTLIHLGDICIGEDEAIHELLRQTCDGVRLVLVRGNHDKKSAEWYYNHGWDFVCDAFHLIFHGHCVFFSHRPKHPNEGNYTHNIHGHTHGNLHRSEEYIAWYMPGYHVDISPEIVGYKPVSLKSLIHNKS